jgi:hypothetical protein
MPDRIPNRIRESLGNVTGMALPEAVVAHPHALIAMLPSEGSVVQRLVVTGLPGDGPSVVYGLAASVPVRLAVIGHT